MSIFCSFFFCRISLRKTVDSELVNWIIIAQRLKDLYQFGCGILKMVGPKKQDFLSENQYTTRKSLYFENAGSASWSKIGHDFRK